MTCMYVQRNLEVQCTLSVYVMIIFSLHDNNYYSGGMKLHIHYFVNFFFDSYL